MVPNHPLQATTRMGSDSAMRHLTQIAMGDTSEDHWAAVAWQAKAALDEDMKRKENGPVLLEADDV